MPKAISSMSAVVPAWSLENWLYEFCRLSSKRWPVDLAFLGPSAASPDESTPRFKSKREWRGLRKANDGSMFHSNNIIHITLPLFHGSLCVMGHLVQLPSA